MSLEARREAGFLLRMLQDGESLGMPNSKPMPSIGANCHELRINDGREIWRVFYRIEPDIILVIRTFKKKTGQTPLQEINLCKKRLKDHDAK